MNMILGFFFLGFLILDGARRGGFGAQKKTRLLNGAGLGFWDKSAGRVRVLKNPAWTRPVAIPN